MKRIMFCVVMVICFTSSCFGSVKPNIAPSPKITVSASPSVKPSIIPSPSPSVKPSPSPSADLTNQVGSGKLGDILVKIVGFEMDKTWQDEPCALITYEWTNNSGETACFMYEVDHQAFQNGIECEAKFMTDRLEESEFLTEVKPGYSLTVKCAYILRDSENPIEIELTKYAGRDEKPFMVRQTFDIKEAA